MLNSLNSSGLQEGLLHCAEESYIAAQATFKSSDNPKFSWAITHNLGVTTYLLGIVRSDEEQKSRGIDLMRNALKNSLNRRHIRPVVGDIKRRRQILARYGKVLVFLSQRKKVPFEDGRIVTIMLTIHG